MKRYLAIIVAAILLMTVWSSAFAVYDPETDGVSVWNGEITTITVTDRLPGIQLENNPFLKELEKRITKSRKIENTLKEKVKIKDEEIARLQQIISGQVPDEGEGGEDGETPTEQN